MAMTTTNILGTSYVDEIHCSIINMNNKNYRRLHKLDVWWKEKKVSKIKRVYNGIKIP